MNQKTPKKKNRKKNRAPYKCIACGTALGIPGGYASTDLCGPCCTCEAETLDEYMINW